MKIPMVLVLLSLLLACGGNYPPGLEVGARAPGFALKDLDGTQVSLDEFAGQPVVLNFWATWCQPCRREIPELIALSATGKAKVVGISLDTIDAKQVKAFARRSGMSYPILMGNESVFRQYQGFGIPHTVVLDADLKVVSVHRGLASKETLEWSIAKATSTPP